VKVVLHPDLSKEPATAGKVAHLEGLQGKGKASFKVAPRNMHEKFTIVDGTYLVNASANMSGGAKTKYSENFVFLTGPDFLIENFENEFAVLWNSSKDIVSGARDAVEDQLPYDATKHQTKGKEVTLYSSSMNYDYVADSQANVQAGRFIKLVPKGGGKGPYTVRDALIDGIKNAKKTIQCSFNHFNILEISQALVEASKRGVDVKLTVDNQEFREKWSPQGIEMTPYFVENWKKLPGNANKSAPVRVKFYSHYPNPAKWYLNHHKFMIVDAGTSDAVLFTGSYNLSETAEHNQYDNMVSYRGANFAKLQKAFVDEFNKLWSLERTNDKPNADAVGFFTTVNNGSLPIHSTRPVAMTFEEIIKLRSDVRAIAPDFLRQMNMKTSSCSGYDVAKKQLFGCAAH
jgi:phosphatidylserine/phosphatidylglycerophosphate/cardiolipin synthase-like enzyme